MSTFQFDRSSKWLIGHYGESMIWLAGERRAMSRCQAVPAEVVYPAKLPDGLFEIEFAQSGKKKLHLMEVFVYPDRKALAQIVHNSIFFH